MFTESVSPEARVTPGLSSPRTKRVSGPFLPPIALDHKGGTPLHRQIYHWFRKAIVDGTMRPGQRLPSSRSLATELKVSRVPVVNAYEQLQAEGFLETVIGSGTCVSRSILEHRPATSRWGARSPEQISGKSRTVSRRGSVMRIPDQPWFKSRGAFRVSLPALEHFPIGIWTRLLARHSRYLPNGLMSYCDPMGYLPFREAVAEYLGAVRGVRCQASQILVTTGSQQGLQLAAQVLLDPGDAIYVEEPGYPGARQAFTSAGAQLIPVQLDKEGIKVSEFSQRSRNARAAYITPSHQYPMGMTMSASRRMVLLDWAKQTSGWIIEDDYDSDYRFESGPIASVQGLDSEARVIYVGTFSKVLFPALRLGYVVVPEDLAPAFAAAREANDIFSATLYQATLNDFIRQGHFGRHIRRMRMLYEERRTALVNAIRLHMGDLLQVIGAESGMHLTALLPPGVNDIELATRVAKKGISAIPLSSCCAAPPPRGGLVLGYGCVNESQIAEGVNKLRAELVSLAS